MTVSVTATVYRKMDGPRNLPMIDTSGPGATGGGPGGPVGGGPSAMVEK